MLGELFTIEVVQNDITREEVDAITNAANSHLMHGGGVAGAISSNGGPDVQKESNEYVAEHGKVPTGEVGVTGPGRLRCRYIIHAVGPMWSSRITPQENCQLLANAVINTLKKANELGCSSVSIPAISSGIFGFPKPLCAHVFFLSIESFTRSVIAQGAEEKPALKTIRLCNFDNETCLIFRAAFDKVAGTE